MSDMHIGEQNKHRQKNKPTDVYSHTFDQFLMMMMMIYDKIKTVIKPKMLSKNLIEKNSIYYILRIFSICT